jgi:hypothetical protein
MSVFCDLQDRVGCLFQLLLEVGRPIPHNMMAWMVFPTMLHQQI